MLLLLLLLFGLRWLLLLVLVHMLQRHGVDTHAGTAQAIARPPPPCFRISCREVEEAS